MRIFSSVLFAAFAGLTFAANERRATECASTIKDGGTYSFGGTAGNLSSDCPQTYGGTVGDAITYTATSCPGCSVTVNGKTTFLEPPASLGCSRDEINAANPCVTSSSSTTISEESSMTSTGSSTSTSTSTTESESKCTINGEERPCDEVTSGGKSAKIAAVSAMAVLSAAVALL